MHRQAIHFGGELRRRRLAAGLTLGQMSRLVHYSKGQLSKVERGLKTPSRELARLCDHALHAKGALAVLVSPVHGQANVEISINSDEEVWVLELSKDGQSRFHPMSRRQVIAAGTASVTGMSITGPRIAAGSEDTTLLGVSRSQFDQYRRLGQVVGPSLLLPTLIAQTHTLRELSTRTGARTRQELLRLAARYAEYIGWLVQETGDDHAALWWTRRAVDLAEAGGDHDLAAYALVRRALITFYREDAEHTIELARQAQRSAAPPRIRGLAAQREAQGHALAGDYDACMRCLDRARILLADCAPASAAPVLGTTNLSDPAAMITGWCLHDLGRSREAAELIDAQMGQVPPHALRTRVRYGVRRALAHAMAGEIDHACRLSADLLYDARAVGSATVALDLRRLARTLSRHTRNPSVRAITPDLSTTIHMALP